MAQVWYTSLIWGGIVVHGNRGTKTYFGLSEEEAVADYLRH